MSHDIPGQQESVYLSDLRLYHPLIYKILALSIPLLIVITILYLVYIYYQGRKEANLRYSSSYTQQSKGGTV